MDDRFQESEIVIIDHHRVKVDERAIQYICPAAPSVTLIVQALIEHVDTVTKQEAYYILFGFLTDSGFFRHLNESAVDSLPYVTRLLSHRYSLRSLYHTLFSNQGIDEVRFVSEIIVNAQSFLGGKLIMATRTKKLSHKYNINYVSGEYVNAQLQLIKGVEVTGLFTELDADVYDVSLRALGSADVSVIAEKFGGGGHVAASGFRWSGTIEAIQMQLIRHVNDSILRKQVARADH